MQEKSARKVGEKLREEAFWVNMAPFVVAKIVRRMFENSITILLQSYYNGITMVPVLLYFGTRIVLVPKASAKLIHFFRNCKYFSNFFVVFILFLQ